MPDHWFFEDDLIWLRREWARLMREYGRTHSPDTLDRAHEAHARYLDRVEQLRGGPGERTADRPMDRTGNRTRGHKV